MLEFKDDENTTFKYDIFWEKKILFNKLEPRFIRIVLWLPRDFIFLVFFNFLQSKKC